MTTSPSQAARQFGACFTPQSYGYRGDAMG
jgi:hypothetical protein